MHSKNFTIGVFGCSGKVGREVADLLRKRNYRIIGFSRAKTLKEFEVMNDLKAFVEKVDYVIEFSTPDAMEDLLFILLKNQKPLVSGTTGHNNFALLHKLSRFVPVLWSANMAFGMNIVMEIIENYTSALKRFNISITETHHVNKRDFPSGTAIALGDIIKEEYCDEKEVEINSIREGDAFGKHEIKFSNEYEEITITHSVLNRVLFAEGALEAMEFLLNKERGLFSMKDILK